MRSRPSLLQQFTAFVTIGNLLALTSGCETVKDYSLSYKLWTTETLRNHREPAPQANLKLFQRADGGDLLVQYDEVNERTEATQRRVYFLSANLKRLEARRKPAFVNLDVATNMNPVPLTPTDSSLTNLPSRHAIYAVVSDDGQQFSLYANDQKLGSYSLPVYVDAGGTTSRILLTPFAAAGDAVMVGLVAGVVALFGFIQSGSSYSFGT